MDEGLKIHRKMTTRQRCFIITYCSTLKFIICPAVGSTRGFHLLFICICSLYCTSDYESKCCHNHGRFSAAGSTPLIKVCYGPGGDNLRAAVNHLKTHSDYVPINQLVSLLTDTPQQVVLLIRHIYVSGWLDWSSYDLHTAHIRKDNTAYMIRQQ